MGLSIHLLGAPHVELDGVPIPGPRGKKAWALLAYLVCTGVPVPRSRLASLLFAEADDPLRALRWNVNQIRNVLGSSALRDDPPALSFAGDVGVDVSILRSGSWQEAASIADLGGDLLGGFDFAAAPAFEMWLLSERSHLRSSSLAVLEECVLASLATDDNKRAIDAATALVGLEPLVEAHHALLIRSYLAAGDNEAAARGATACVSLFQKELGVDPGPVVLEALHETPVSIVTRSPSRAAAVAKAQLRSGEAAVRAGFLDAGLDCFTRAIEQAQACGDVVVKSEALMQMGSALAHAGRERQQDAAAALHAALALAEEHDLPDVAGISSTELAWLEFLAGRYDRAQTWLDRAAAALADDASVMARVLWISGKIQMERGSCNRSIELLRTAVEFANAAGDASRAAFCHISSGRAYLVTRRLDEAQVEFDAALDLIASSGAAWLMPFAQAFVAELRLLRGDIREARDLAEEALALAEHVGDSSVEATAERSLALCFEQLDDADTALQHLLTARARMIQRPDHMWSFAYVLDALATVGNRHAREETSRWVDELLAVASSSGMKEMLVRAHLHRARMGDDDALEAASIIALGCDNPCLDELLADAARVHSA
ncbi:MAG: BTAD domain-containing putative transcriptional regulator [Actinomycetota bacterium]